ncbi:hypothetical protein DRO69_01465 [Candidatus Bathyarchaeota archaeon]|nr:MAG: hypothetical protein DRO69_01465 [Candidatus Bathyarchaeota archaeon]
MTLIDFLVQYRVYFVIAIFLAWFIYALHHTGKLRIRRVSLKRAPSAALIPVEQRLSITEAELARLRKENERLTLQQAEIKRKQAEKEIEKIVEKEIRAILPEKLYLFDPDNQPISRPIYYIGGVPCIEKKEEINRIIDRSPILKALSKLSASLAYKLADFLYFKGDTLYFYTAELLPNGHWCIAATSKPARKTGRYIKLPRICETYILLSSGQRRIDDLIVNKWEVIKAGAAIHLAATVLGPFPAEEYSQIKRNAGWFVEEKS